MQIALILLALAFPLLELAVLIKVGQSIGVWWTIALLLATGIFGGLLVHQQGLAAARRALEAMQNGRPPIEPVADSLMLMTAGMLLLVPGLITDAAGLVLLVPQLRRWVARWALGRLFAGAEVHVEGQQWRSPGEHGAEPPPGTTRRAPDGGVVIEGEWKHVPDPKPDPDRAGRKGSDGDHGRGN